MPGSAKRSPRVTDPDANSPTRELIDEIVPDAAAWLKTPSTLFGDFDEAVLHNFVLGMKDGIRS